MNLSTIDLDKVQTREHVRKVRSAVLRAGLVVTSDPREDAFVDRLKLPETVVRVKVCTLSAEMRSAESPLLNGPQATAVAVPTIRATESALPVPGGLSLAETATLVDKYAHHGPRRALPAPEANRATVTEVLGPEPVRMIPQRARDALVAAAARGYRLDPVQGGDVYVTDTAGRWVGRFPSLDVAVAAVHTMPRRTDP